MQRRRASTLDLFTDSIRRMGDATLCAVMEFDRRLDPARLEAAAHACLLAHPILHSRLVRGDGPAVWEPAEPARVPLEAEVCADDYRSRVAGPVDPHGPRQFRVRLLRRPAGDGIVVNVAHAAADASGLRTLAAQLLEEYVSPGSIAPARGGLPERDTLWTRDLCPPGEGGPAPSPMLDALWPDPFGACGGASSFHRDRVDPPALDAIRARARSLGGTLNDALMASFYLAMTDLTGHRGPIAVCFPVDLRRHLADGSRAISNQAANVGFTLDRPAGAGMEEILPRVVAATVALKAGRIGVAEQAAMDAGSDPEGRNVERMVEEMAALQGRGLADIFISNPGPLALPGIDGLDDAYLCYPGCRMPSTCFVTSTFRGRMTITMGYQESGRAREGTRRAMRLFREHLLSLADGR